MKLKELFEVQKSAVKYGTKPTVGSKIRFQVPGARAYEWRVTTGKVLNIDSDDMVTVKLSNGDTETLQWPEEFDLERDMNIPIKR